MGGSRTSMKIVFFGTPSYVIPILKMLKETNDVLAVVTQPPKPSGRKKIMTYSPVDTYAHKKKMKIVTNLKDMPPADLGVLAAYGEIIPDSIISNFKRGIINIHPSLLPKFRGASPVQANIIADPDNVGATIIKLDSLMDHGPILAKFRDSYEEADSTDTLRTRIFEKSAQVLEELLVPFEKGKIKPKIQNEDIASYTKLIKKADAEIPGEFFKNAIAGKETKKPWSIAFIKNYEILPNPESIQRFISAMNPWPIAFCMVSLGKNWDTKSNLRLKIHKSKLVEGVLIPEIVQLEGKNPVSWSQFMMGHPDITFS